MRSFRFLPIGVVLGALAFFATSTGAVERTKSRCVIPHGWRLVAKDRQAVVIRERHNPRYDYCLRSNGRLQRLAPLASYERIVGSTLQLRGAYVAAALQNPASLGGGYGVALWGLRGHLENETGGCSSSPCSFLLSPTGVAAWISPPAELRPPTLFVLTIPHDRAPASLDSGDGLGNLQLYRCAAGCAPNTTVVAWTHSGGQRYAHVTGGG